MQKGGQTLFEGEKSGKRGSDPVCTVHGLRYAAGSRLRELGCDGPTIAAILGHRTAEMVRKYTEQERRAKLAIARLDEARAARSDHDPKGNDTSDAD